MNPSQSSNMNKKDKNTPLEEDEKFQSSSNINLQESSDSDSDSEKKSDSKSSKNSSSDDVESLTDSIDEERITLGQINKLARKAQKKKEKMDVKSFLQKKRHLDPSIITYDEKKGKIIKDFCTSKEELEEFLSKCEAKKITLDELTDSEKNVETFDPNEWMKANKISQRTINMEDLQVYCRNKEPKNNEKEKKKEKIDFKENIPKIEKKRSIYLKNKKIYEDYVNLQKIIECKILSIEQKEWISDLISRIKKIDIKDINIEKNSEDKFNKLEVVFDLDNTCIYSFVSNSDFLNIQNKKKILPQKDVRVISFKFNNRVIYTALIIRKGLKEFLNYVSPLCNFHINTLGAESYGNEVKDILELNTGVKFIRFKGKIYANESTKYISDLYIKKENTVIFDDYLSVWDNKSDDKEQTIISKYFYDEECAMLSNDYIVENNNYNNIINEIELFLRSYRTFCYTKIRDNSKISFNYDIDWKVQESVEYQKVPFYQFSSNKDLNYNTCFTAEYLNSPKLQFDYMKEVIKVLYFLRFVFDVDIKIAIKLIKICTLNNMKFELKYWTEDQETILTDMIKVCGGVVIDKNYNYVKNNKDKIYLVVSKKMYEFKKNEINNLMKKNENYYLINERFIIDTYYFMTDIRDNINDPEYIHT